tara:strand:+ start:2836 stop:3474 length:639 start_codon:yes stop_codon:yes gene_type:complete
VVFADDHVVVVDKPAGLLSVPGKFLKDCVQQRILFDYPDARIVHRLDLDTSGLMVLGQTREAVANLNAQFRERRVRKRYRALVHGALDSAHRTICLPLAPDPLRRPRHRVDLLRGKSALTRLIRLQLTGDVTEVDLMPETGRSHQLRLHMASIGHAIYGCDLYAPPQVLKAAPRLMLHASMLFIEHPVSFDAMSFESPASFSIADVTVNVSF